MLRRKEKKKHLETFHVYNKTLEHNLIPTKNTIYFIFIFAFLVACYNTTYSSHFMDKTILFDL